MEKIFKFKRNNNSVSQVLGTILLLGIAVAIFSVLYIIVLSEPFDAEEPYPTTVTFVEGGKIIIEHRGGEELGVDNTFSFEFGDASYAFNVGDLLKDSNSDNKWNIGERLILDGADIGSDTIFDWNILGADVAGSDLDNNRLIMSGELDIRPSGDIGLEVFVDNPSPKVGDTVNITIAVSLYYGDLAAPNVEIKYLLPDSLEYWDYSPKSADYNKDTGIWNISNLNAGDTVYLIIKANVSLTGYNANPTQLCMLIDGSGSILGPNSNVGDGPDWGLIIDGLANGTKSGIPHDGSVELIIIQFANSYASLEIGPIIVTEDNYMSIVGDILDITQRAYDTPMACGLIRTADELYKSINNPSKGGNFSRQVTILVTDGQPTACCNLYDSDPYYGDYCYVSTEQSSIDARNFLLNKLQMNESFDELNSLAVGSYGSGPDVNWLKNNIIWPGNYIWLGDENPGPGWVREVNTWQNFSDAIDETFTLLFGNINFSIELLNSPLIDLDNQNDRISITITPSDE